MIVSRNLKISVFILCLCSVAAMYFRADTLSWDRAALALAIAWVGFIPGLVFLATLHSQRDPFPLMPYVGLFYAVFFGLSGFTGAYLRNNDSGMIRFFGQSYLDQISVDAQVLALIGVALMLSIWAITKQLFSSWIPRYALPNLYPAWRLQVLIWGLVIFNLLYIHLPFIRSLPSIGQFLQPAGYVGFALMLAMNYKGDFPRWQIYAYFGIALPLWVGGLLVTGSLTPLMLVAGLWIAVHLYFIGRLPWKWLLVSALMLVLAYPMMSGFRGLTWTGGPSQSVVQKLGQIDDAVEGLLSLRGAQLYERSTGIFRRSGLIFTFSHVVEETPQKVPYWKGETYRPMVTSWVPRVLWRDKPEEKAGYAFGARYALIGVSNTHMSYNLPWLTELYANFGLIGVILGMPLIGLFLGLLDCIFNKRGLSALEYGVGAAVLLPLTFQESNFTLMTGSLLPLAICLWLYFSIGLRFMTRKAL